MEINIVIESEDGDCWTEHVITRGPVTIGRHSRSTVCLDGDLVSRHHAIVHVGPHLLRVEDVSTNGTKAGAVMLRRSSADVEFGTPIRVGEYTLKIRLGPAEPGKRRHSARHARPALKPTLEQPLQEVQQPTAPPALSERPPLCRWSSSQRLCLQLGSRPNRWSPPSSDLPIPQSLACRRAGPAPRTAVAPGIIDLRRELHDKLEARPGHASELLGGVDGALRGKVVEAVRRLVSEATDRIPASLDRERLIAEVVDEAVGTGPLAGLLADAQVSAVWVAEPQSVFVQRAGRMERTDVWFTGPEQLLAVIARMVAPLGLDLEEDGPVLQGRLQDGSMLHAVLPPVAMRGPLSVVAPERAGPPHARTVGCARRDERFDGALPVEVRVRAQGRAGGRAGGHRKDHLARRPHRGDSQSGADHSARALWGAGFGSA